MNSELGANGNVLVCIDEHPKAIFLLRAGKRRAKELGVDWEAVHVETPRYVSRLKSDERVQLLQTLTLAEQMGAKIIHIEASTPHEGIARLLQTREESGRKIGVLVIGEEDSHPLKHLLVPSLAQRLVRLVSDTEIRVIALGEGIISSNRWQDRLPDMRVKMKDIVFSLIAVWVAYMTAELLKVLMPYEMFGNDANVGLIFMVACAFSAGRYGLIPGVVASVVSFLTMNYYYIAPYKQMILNDLSDALNLGIFLCATMVIALFVSHTRAHGEEVSRRATRLQTLFRLHRVSLSKHTRGKTIHALHQELVELLEMEVYFFMPEAMHDDVVRCVYPEGAHFSEEDQRALAVCWEEGKTTGVGSPYNPGAELRYEPLLTVNDEIGVLGVRIEKSARLSASFGRLLTAIADQVALILERLELSEMMEESRINIEREKLRSMLLSSVSHDLKTPLASIIGSLSVFRSMGERLQEAQRATLIQTALEEAHRLDSFITNILDMTRIESGQIDFRQEWLNPILILQRVMKRLRERLSRHEVSLMQPFPENLEVCMDAMMTEQVLQNVLDNAAKYTPSGTRIEILCTHDHNAFSYIIRDYGPGIPDDKLSQVFDKYARLHKEDTQVAGTGLGLAISKSVMHAQGGEITVRNHADGGAEFTIRFSRCRPINNNDKKVA